MPDAPLWTSVDGNPDAREAIIRGHRYRVHRPYLGATTWSVSRDGQAWAGMFASRAEAMRYANRVAK
jgi:hypothetical protein